LPVRFKGGEIREVTVRFIVEKTVVVEIKAVEEIANISLGSNHVTYLRTGEVFDLD